MDFEKQGDGSLVSLFSKMIRLHFIRVRELLETIDLYPGQPQLLVALHQHGTVSQTELAHMLLVRPATVTVMIQRLEKAGLVTKRQDERDLRKSIVELTEAGTERYRQFTEINRQIEQECRELLTNDEWETMRVLLGKVNEGLASHVSGTETFHVPYGFKEETTK